MSNSVLVLGASGRFGRSAALAFETAGWDVRRFDRANDQLETAVREVDVVVNAWNPPDYSTWAQDLLGMHMRVIRALKGSDTTVIVPGNVYVFGAQTPTPWAENSVHNARNPLGKLRIQMEAAYREAGVRTILLRGGDFLDTAASGNWFDLIMTKKLHKGRFVYPGDVTAAHTWAFLPDITRAAVGLAEKRHDLPVYCDVPFAGFTLTGAQIATVLSRVTGRKITAKTMGWLPLRILAPVMKSLRGLLEMRYLWDTPHNLDDTLLRKLLPEFEPTPLDTAFAQTIAHLDLPTPEYRGAVIEA